MTSPGLEEKIHRLQGPVLVLGAGGFLGANLLRTLLLHRDDAYGTVFHGPAWRLDGVPARHAVAVDLLVDVSRHDLLERIKPRTVFNCVGYGGYSFESDSELIYETNFNLTAKVLKGLEALDIACYVHSGSSSEYGDKAAAAKEDDLPQPNSDYAVSKVSCANLIRLYGKKKALPCANLRLFSAYGPLEDASRLIPDPGQLRPRRDIPRLRDRDISRDFVYVDDVCEAYVDTAVNLRDLFFGDSFNIGTGHKTAIARRREMPPRAVRHFRRAGLRRCRVELGPSRLVLRIDKTHPRFRLAGAHRLPRGPCVAPLTGTAASRTRTATIARRSNLGRTAYVASPRSWPATKTTGPSRSCTSG